MDMADNPAMYEKMEGLDRRDEYSVTEEDCYDGLCFMQSVLEGSKSITYDGLTLDRSDCIGQMKKVISDAYLGHKDAGKRFDSLVQMLSKEGFLDAIRAREFKETDPQTGQTFSSVDYIANLVGNGDTPNIGAYLYAISGSKNPLDIEVMFDGKADTIPDHLTNLLRKGDLRMIGEFLSNRDIKQVMERVISASGDLESFERSAERAFEVLVNATAIRKPVKL